MFSSLKAFIRDTIASIITRIKGKAAATEAVCRASKPPASRREVANKDWTKPHRIFLLLEGFRSPSEVNIPSIKVAEFADVIKKVDSSTTVTMDSIEPRG